MARTMKTSAALVLLSILPTANTINLNSFNDPQNTVAKEAAFQTSALGCPPVNISDFIENDYFKSENGEDKCLLTFFRGLCNGRYVDLGALDGITHSNTFAFHYGPGLQWRGVNVEIIYENYEQLIINRPDDLGNAHAAVCDEPKTQHYIRGRNDVDGGIREFSSKTQRERWFGNEVDLQDTIPVNCIPPQIIFDDVVGEMYDKYFFDFASIDVLGAEFAALLGIDFERTGFGILVVANNNNDDRREITNFLASKGYDRVYNDDCSQNENHKRRNSWYISRQFNLIYDKVRKTDGRKVPPRSNSPPPHSNAPIDAGIWKAHDCSKRSRFRYLCKQKELEEGE